MKTGINYVDNTTKIEYICLGHTNDGNDLFLLKPLLKEGAPIKKVKKEDLKNWTEIVKEQKSTEVAIIPKAADTANKNVENFNRAIDILKKIDSGDSFRCKVDIMVLDRIFTESPTIIRLPIITSIVKAFDLELSILLNKDGMGCDIAPLIYMPTEEKGSLNMVSEIYSTYDDSKDFFVDLWDKLYEELKVIYF